MQARLALLGVLGVAQALLYVLGSGTSPSQQLLAVACAAVLGTIALVWIALDQSFQQTPLWFVLALALLLRLIAVQATPLLEDDYFRYLWDGLQTATKLDPYLYPPDHFFGQADLSKSWQDVLSGINHPEVPSIYGPVLQGLFALAYWINPGQVGAIQGLLLVVDMLTMALLARFQAGPRWLLVYAMHPLVLKESMASAHPDILLGFFLVCALLAWRKHRAVFTGFFLALASGTKVPALVALVFLIFKPRLSPGFGPKLTWISTLAAALFITLAFIYLPFLLQGASEGSALAVFGSSWRFNPLLFRIIEPVFEWAFLLNLLSEFRPEFVSLWGPKLSRLTAAFMLGAGTVALLWRWVKLNQPNQPNQWRWPPLASAIALLLLLSPTVNPWYWLWALAPSILMRQYTFAIAGCVGLLSYWNTSVIAISAVWIVPNGLGQNSVPAIAAWIQIIVIGAAWIVDYRRASNDKQ